MVYRVYEVYRVDRVYRRGLEDLWGLCLYRDGA